MKHRHSVNAMLEEIKRLDLMIKTFMKKHNIPEDFSRAKVDAFNKKHARTKRKSP